ncbi:MAG: CpsB/CapC family capsule biosynthesis tyrosine phosphatase [Bacteroidota bacterium]
MGFFSKHSKPKPPIDLSVLKADIHSHFIPGIDDGVNSIEESLSLIREMKQMGYQKLITTPHIQHDFFKNTPEIILKGLDELKAAVHEAEIDIEIEAAAEYLIDEGFEYKLKNEKLLTFGDNFVLIELSYYMPYPNLPTVLFNLQLEGYNIVLAHPERYSYWFNQFDKFEELKDRGMLLQLNVNSLGGYYDTAVRKMAEQLVKLKFYDLVGSDMHNNNYLEGLKVAVQTKSFELLLSTNTLVNNKL